MEDDKTNMSAKKRVLVTGAGGFIGHHLSTYLVERGYWVRGVDIKEPEYEASAAQEFEVLDLRRFDNCLIATRGVSEVYGLAADMGGIGFIETNKGEIVRNNTLINLHSIEAARINGVQRYLYTSSACIYPGYLQKSPGIAPLKENDAYPADAEDGYGWEKLYMERVCRHYSEDFGLPTRVVRFHNIFGPLGTYDGGREKSRRPSAAKSHSPATAPRSKFGAMASKRARTATLTTASRGSTGSCGPISPSR